jgi:nucleoside-diphosphate-sugar epimerase
VLRYGGIYGSPDDALLEPVRKRRFPIVGDGGGVWSFVHLEDAATATVLALERGTTGIYNVVDDEPAPVRELLPALAAAIGAKPPRRVPRRLARLLAGESGVVLMTEVRGASEREGEARARLGASLPELARRIRQELRHRLMTVSTARTCRRARRS